MYVMFVFYSFNKTINKCYVLQIVVATPAKQSATQSRTQEAAHVGCPPLVHTLQVHTFHCSRKEENWIGQFLQYSKAKVVDGVLLQYNSCYCTHGWMDGLSIAQISTNNIKSE